MTTKVYGVSNVYTGKKFAVLGSLFSKMSKPQFFCHMTPLCIYCEFLTPYIRNTATKSGTNPNESLNASIRTTAPKRLAFGSSYEARAGIAIGLKNDHKYFI